MTKEIQDKLNEAYETAIVPLENYQEKSNTISGMMQFMAVFGAAIADFGDKVNQTGADLLKKYPESDAEIREYSKVLHNKFISTYKPR